MHCFDSIVDYDSAECSIKQWKTQVGCCLRNRSLYILEAYVYLVKYVHNLLFISKLSCSQSLILQPVCSLVASPLLARDTRKPALLPDCASTTIAFTHNNVSTWRKHSELAQLHHEETCRACPCASLPIRFQFEMKRIANHRQSLGVAHTILVLLLVWKQSLYIRAKPAAVLSRCPCLLSSGRTCPASKPGVHACLSSNHLLEHRQVTSKSLHTRKQGRS